MQYLSGQRLCFHKRNQDCMLEICQSGSQHFEGMAPTAGAGRSADRRRVEWDQLILNQNIPIKVRHRSELVFARVYLVFISGQTSMWMGMHEPNSNNSESSVLGSPQAIVQCNPKHSLCMLECLSGYYYRNCQGMKFLRRLGYHSMRGTPLCPRSLLHSEFNLI
jgi:hypothetical protein